MSALVRSCPPAGSCLWGIPWGVSARLGDSIPPNEAGTMLTDIQLKKAKSGEKDYKLADGGGLHVLVPTTDNRSWRLKYRFGKKEKLLTIGTYPDISLREARDDAKRAIREGHDPGVEKKQAAAALLVAADNSFEVRARGMNSTGRAGAVPVSQCGAGHPAWRLRQGPSPNPWRRGSRGRSRRPWQSQSTEHGRAADRARRRGQGC